MYPHDIIFALNDTERLVADLTIPFQELPCFCQITIFFYDGYTEYLLNVDESLETGMCRFREILAKSINGSFYLHPSLMQDIGYWDNEYWRYASNRDDDTWQLNPYLIYDNNEMWVGFKYQLWAYERVVAWMYNDVNGNIIFEITSQYSGFFVEEGEVVTVPPYDEWMKIYKPTLVRVVPKDVAQQWLIQANTIIAHIEKTFDRSTVSEENDGKLKYEDCPRN